MSGLKSITLYHSYLKGLKTKIICDGHTNLMGDNGVGKTSLLKLIPLFMGNEPSKIMDKGASKLSFVDYYLPNQQSMIIFEYERLDGTICCAVFYRSGGDTSSTYVHRFVVGAADDTIFHPSLKPHYDNKDKASTILRQPLKDLGVTVSQQISHTNEYNYVINNSQQFKSRKVGVSKNLRHLRDDARRFSLGSANDSIHYMDELTSVTLQSGQHIARLKTMIIDTQINSHITSSKPNSNNAELWRNIESLNEFEKVDTELRKGISTYHDLMKTLDMLFLYTTELDAKITSLDGQLENDREAQRVLTLEKDKIVDAFEAVHKEMVKTITTVNAEVEHLDQVVEALLEKRDEWDAMDIDNIVLRYKGLPTLREDIKDAKHHLALLRKEGEELESSMERERAELIQRNDKVKDRIAQDISRIRDAQSTLKSKHESEREQLQAERDTHIQEAQDAFSAQFSELQAQRGVLLQARHDATQRTEGEHEAEQQSKDAITLTERNRDEVIQSLQEGQEKITVATQALTQSEATLIKAESKLSHAQSERDVLHQNRFAEKGTLLAYLRENKPDWGDSIGKVISKELLHRKDLSPEVLTDETSFYGILMDTTALTKPDEALEQDQLETLLAHAKQQVSFTKKEVDQAKLDVIEARKDLTSIQNQVAVLKAQQSSLSERIRDLKEADSDLRKAHDANARARASEYAANIETINASITLAEEGYAALKSNIVRDFQEAMIQIKGNQSDELHTLEDELEMKNEQLKEAKETLKTRLKDLDASLKQALSEKGIDVAVRASAEDKVKTLATQIEFLEGKKDDVLEYEHWEKTHWDKLTAKEQKIKELRRQLSSLTAHKDEKERTHDVVMADMKKQRNKLKNDIQRGESKREDWRNINDLASRAMKIVPKGEASVKEATQQELGTGEQVGQEVSRLTDQLRNKSDEVIKVSKRCHDIILRHSNTHVAVRWDRLHEHLREKRKLALGSEELSIAAMDVLSALMDEYVPEIKSGLIQSIRSVAGRMTSYHDTLSTMNNDINRVSRELKEKLNTEHDFPQISDISVQLVSLISGDEQWKTLSGFSKSWEEWLRHNDNTNLPPSDLLNDLRKLEEAYRNGKGGSSNVHDLIDIEVQLTENGRVVPIRSDKDFEDASSKGLSTIAMLIIFSGMTRYLCPNEDIRITWPIDELGSIDPKNIQRLFAMMQRRNINLLCAQPKATPELLRRFDHKMRLDKNLGAMTVSNRADRPKNKAFLDVVETMKQTTPQTEVMGA